ncbi:hypothetical protein IT774_08835 [Salinimonas marina]|uniref:Uncharacterized protein n=1 Tax=Salinimonas marina TaxID=2785918 RepID=A0A7S9DUT5_9ALTE|nr:hypothetical protein [Salinimonas marina]QPG04378.1 hypothetical protein IT774_08835 [Salinimonas marina]
MQPSLAIICENFKTTPDPTVMALCRAIRDRQLESEVISLPCLQHNQDFLRPFAGVIFSACCTQSSGFRLVDKQYYAPAGQIFSGVMKNQLATAYTHNKLHAGNINQLLELSLFCTRNDMIWLGDDMAASEVIFSPFAATDTIARAYTFGLRMADIVIRWHQDG